MTKSWPKQRVGVHRAPAVLSHGTELGQPHVVPRVNLVFAQLWHCAFPGRCWKSEVIEMKPFSEKMGFFKRKKFQSIESTETNEPGKLTKPGLRFRKPVPIIYFMAALMSWPQHWLVVKNKGMTSQCSALAVNLPMNQQCFYFSLSIYTYIYISYIYISV